MMLRLAALAAVAVLLLATVGWQAASVAFEFGQDGQQIEYDTWVHTEKTHVYFRGICPASGVYNLQDRMQILVVGATTIP